MSLNDKINKILGIIIIAMIVGTIVVYGLKYLKGEVNTQIEKKETRENIRIYEYNEEVKAKINYYDNATDIYFCQERAKVSKDGKWGFIDIEGNVKVSTVYDEVYDFSNGVAKVMLDGKYGLVNLDGKTITSIVYDNIYTFINGKAKIKRNKMYGYIDTNGIEIIEPKYNYIDDFNDGLAVVGMGGRYGYINELGEVAIPLDYGYADSFSEGLAYVKKDGESYYIDKTNNVVLSLSYDYMYTFSNGIAKVQKGDKFGFIDKKGELITPIKYTSAAPFLDGLSKVEVYDKSGYVDMSGDEVIPIIFDKVYEIDHGFIRTFDETDAIWRVFKTDGTEVMNGKFELIGPYKCGLALLAYKDKNGKIYYGYMDENLNNYGFNFAYAEDFDETTGTAFVEYNDQRGNINVDQVVAISKIKK